MKKNILFVMSIALLTSSAFGCNVKAPWARESSGTTSAIFMQLKNGSQTDISLIKAECALCETTELHDHIQEGQVFKMRPISEIKVPAHGSVELKRGGKHIMLIGLKQPLKAGDKVPVTFSYSDGSVKQLNVDVKPVYYNSDAKHTCNCEHNKKKA